MSAGRLKVLLIEDLPVYVLLLKKILKQNEIDSESAGSLAEGLQHAEKQTFDAVLLDLGLPDSHGLHTFTRFQSANPTLPVIILSGLDDESLAARAVQLSTQDYLTKGNHLTHGGTGSKLLVRSLQYAIERHRIQIVLLQERSLLEARVNERTSEIREANHRLRALAARLVSAQEDERHRVSIELHDEAGQALTALQLSLSLMRTELPEGSDQLENQLQEAIELTGVTLDRLRVLAQNLRPPALDNVGLDQSLRDYCQRMGSRAHLQMDYRASGIEQIPGHVQISLYRIVQEALTNIVKHARASHVWVHIESDAEGVALSVIDDGVGFPAEDWQLTSRHAGIGLTGMRERVEALGGTFEIISEPGKGVSVRVLISLQEGA